MADSPDVEVGLAAKFREPADVRKGSVEVAQETASHGSVVDDGIAPQGQGESLDVSFEDLFEAASGLTHEICEEPKRVRFSTARAYSRQTSCGASWT